MIAAMVTLNRHCRRLSYSWFAICCCICFVVYITWPTIPLYRDEASHDELNEFKDELNYAFRNELINEFKNNPNNVIHGRQNRKFTDSKCEPRQNVVFLKTHKTASSSIQNILMRYSKFHDLLLAIPKHYNYFGHPKPFQVGMTRKLKRGYHYNIFTYHTRFNYGALKTLMPDDTRFVTILREPASLFESVYDFYYLPWLLNMTLVEFLNLDSSKMDKLNRRATVGRIGRNQMSFDLGVNVDQFEDDDQIREIVQTLDKQVDLVMITERMNESLILLKHLMCWTTDDVITFKLNARKEANKTPLTQELTSKILKWNRADKMLYDYFLKRFDERVQNFGKDRMAAEVKELTDKIEAWFKFCEPNEGGPSDFFEGAVNLQVKNKDNSTCKYIAMPEMDFTEEMLKKQREVES